VAEQVGCERRAYEGGEEEENDEADTAERKRIQTSSQ
jgi:hypothetical protein